MGLLHLYHDYILYKSTKSPDDKPPSAVEQYVCLCLLRALLYRFSPFVLRFGCTNRLTRMVRVPLSLITHTQVLSEVLARKIGGEVGKWRVVRPQQQAVAKKPWILVIC